MKKITLLSKKLYVLAIVVVCSLTATAYDFMVDGIYYNIIGENEVEVTYNDSVKYQGEVIVPATVTQDGVVYHVTMVGRKAFYECSELTLVGLPEGVTRIDEMAFEGCRNLEYMEFPNSLVSIGRWAFNYCYKIRTLNITRNVTDIAYNVFAHFSGMEYYTCSALNPKYKAVDGILYTKDMTTVVAYPQADPSTSYVIPSTVTTLGDYCLHNCDSLREIIIPESVTKLGMNIFSHSDNIEYIYIPDGVTSMGVTVFGNCRKLKHVHLPANADSILSSFFYYCMSLEDLTIPRNVKYIGTYSFSDCRNLKSITFEEGSCLDLIDLRSFERCYALESFDMPNSVTALGGQIFGYCNSLKSVHLSENLQTLTGPTFYFCDALTSVEVPPSVTRIETIAFDFCASLKSIKIGSKDAAPGTTYIDSDAIFECPELQRLEFGANVDSLDHYALFDVKNLKVFISWALNPPRFSETYEIAPASRNCPLYVPRAAVDAYSQARYWKYFTQIVPIEDVGDINNDGSITVGDVTALISQVLNGEAEGNALADVNLDGAINVSDVSALISRILSGS